MTRQKHFVTFLRNVTSVTLVCEDNQQILCHKVVLAASSSIIKDMLRSSSHSHLYFWGVKARDLARLARLHIQGPGAGLPV